jgi:hypothetical protein
MKKLSTRIVAPLMLGCTLVLFHTTSATAAQQLCVNGNAKALGSCLLATPSKSSDVARNVIVVKQPVFLSAAALKNAPKQPRIQLACGPVWCP